MMRIVVTAAVVVAVSDWSPAGAGEPQRRTATADSTSKPASGPLREIEERCKWAAEELRANPSEADAWKETLKGCREDVKSEEAKEGEPIVTFHGRELTKSEAAEERDRIARGERNAEANEERERREERAEEARLEAALRRKKVKLRELKRAEIEALKSLCSASVREVVAEENRTGHYLREYWRRCR